MTRKGRLEEIFSKALYADDAALYFVSYRDFENIVEVPLQEFLKLSENFALIPQNRILCSHTSSDLGKRFKFLLQAFAATFRGREFLAKLAMWINSSSFLVCCI